jgi:hypothetical protein
MVRGGWVVVAWLAGACGEAPSDGSVAALYGAVHLHEFQGGSHPGASFLSQPVPATAVSGDSIVPDPIVPDDREGACALSSSGSAIASQRPPEWVDAGEVHVRGGLLPIDLRFDRTARTYLPASSGFESAVLFEGGERLLISGDGGSVPAFSGAVEAPRPIVLLEPRELTNQAVAATVRWVPDAEPGATVEVDLAVSYHDNRWALISCTIDDAAAELEVSPRLMAQLGPDRSLSLAVARNRTVRVRAKGQLGVVLHAGYQLTLEGQ